MVQPGPALGRICLNCRILGTCAFISLAMPADALSRVDLYYRVLKSWVEVAAKPPEFTNLGLKDWRTQVFFYLMLVTPSISYESIYAKLRAHGSSNSFSAVGDPVEKFMFLLPEPQISGPLAPSKFAPYLVKKQGYVQIDEETYWNCSP